MRPVDQTNFEPFHGDCMRACIASIFELPIENVPNFMRDGPSRYEEYLTNWLGDMNLAYIDVRIEDKEIGNRLLRDCFVVAVGTSPRATRDNHFNHGVVWRNGEIVHDPHPDRTGLANGEPSIYTIFILKDPSEDPNIDD